MLTVTEKQERQDWLARRREGIGSSDIAALFDLDPWRTAYHVYLDKVGELADEDSPRKEWGRRLEDVVAYAYEKETGRNTSIPDPKVVEHRSLPYLLCTPDRWIYLDGQKAVLELKTAGYAHDEWGEEGTDQIPRGYLLQVQHQLLVTGLPVAHVAVLFGVDDFKRYVVEASDSIHQKIIKRATAFWEKNVLNRVPPEPTWDHKGTLPLMRDIYQEIIPVPNLVLGVDDLAREYLRLTEQTAESTFARDKVKAQLLDAMGDAEEARTPRGYKLRRKKVKRRAYTVEATEYIQFNLSDKGVS